MTGVQKCALPILLFAVAIYVLIEAVGRLGDPPDIASAPVFIVGVIGLVVNVVAFLLLREGAEESLNVKGAYFEVVADMIGSIGVIVAASVMWLTGWGWVDAVIGAAIGVFILPRAWRLGRSALRILLQAAPEGVDVGEVTAALASLDGVADVHDVHLWTLTSGMDVLTAHVTVAAFTPSQRVLESARTMLADRFQLTHATLQVEASGDHGCDDMTW